MTDMKQWRCTDTDVATGVVNASSPDAAAERWAQHRAGRDNVEHFRARGETLPPGGWLFTCWIRGQGLGIDVRPEPQEK